MKKDHTPFDSFISQIVTPFPTHAEIKALCGNEEVLSEVADKVIADLEAEEIQKVYDRR